MKQRKLRPGMLVYAMLRGDPAHIDLLGFGVYEGCFQPPHADEFDMLFGGNPRIRLADGSHVWGFQCWWDRVQKWAGFSRKALVVPVKLDGTPNFELLCAEYHVSNDDLTSIVGHGLKYACIDLQERFDAGGMSDELLDAITPAIPGWLEAHTHRCACSEKFWDADQEAITNHEYDCRAYHEELNEGDEDSPRGYRPRPRSPWRSSDEAEQMVWY